MIGNGGLDLNRDSVVNMLDFTLFQKSRVELNYCPYKKHGSNLGGDEGRQVNLPEDRMTARRQQ